MSQNFMDIAIEEAMSGITQKHGGPFGSVVVSAKGEIIGKGHNMVLVNFDPTAHGEVMALRDACKNVSLHNLKGCVLYTTCYPCPMCLSACLWAGIDKIYYGCTSKEADAIGFNDDNFYAVLESEEKRAEITALDEHYKDCQELFKVYDEQIGGERY